RRLREAGHGAEEVARALLTLDVRPVLTAHPTESARRTILDLQARLAEGLLARDGAPEPQRRAIEGRLEGEVELLWLTEEVRRDRPSVMDEVSNALWYLEDRLLEADWRVGAESSPQRRRAAPPEGQLHASPGRSRPPRVRLARRARA